MRHPYRTMETIAKFIQALAEQREILLIEYGTMNGINPSLALVLIFILILELKYP